MDYKRKRLLSFFQQKNEKSTSDVFHPGKSRNDNSFIKNVLKKNNSINCSSSNLKSTIKSLNKIFSEENNFQKVKNIIKYRRSKEKFDMGSPSLNQVLQNEDTNPALSKTRYYYYNNKYENFKTYSPYNFDEYEKNETLNNFYRNVRNFNEIKNNHRDSNTHNKRNKENKIKHSIINELYKRSNNIKINKVKCFKKCDEGEGDEAFENNSEEFEENDKAEKNNKFILGSKTLSRKPEDTKDLNLANFISFGPNPNVQEKENCFLKYSKFKNNKNLIQSKVINFQLFPKIKKVTEIEEEKEKQKKLIFQNDSELIDYIKKKYKKDKIIEMFDIKKEIKKELKNEEILRKIQLNSNEINNEDLRRLLNWALKKYHQFKKEKDELMNEYYELIKDNESKKDFNNLLKEYLDKQYENDYNEKMLKMFKKENKDLKEENEKLKKDIKTIKLSKKKKKSKENEEDNEIQLVEDISDNLK